MSEFEFPKLNRIYKRGFASTLTKADNDRLFDIVMENQQPDGYDGCFSDEQTWKATVSMDYLIHKLKQHGFLTTDYTK